MAKTRKTKIASSPSLEGLQKLINDYFLSTTYRIEDGKVYNSKGLYAPGLVEQKGGRFYFFIVGY